MSGADPRATQAGTGIGQGPVDAGQEGLSFLQMIQTLELDSSLKFEIHATVAQDPEAATTPDAPAPQWTADTQLAGAIVTPEAATWVPDRRAAWFALREAGVADGRVVPAGGNGLPPPRLAATGPAVSAPLTTHAPAPPQHGADAVAQGEVAARIDPSPTLPAVPHDDAPVEFRMHGGAPAAQTPSRATLRAGGPPADGAGMTAEPAAQAATPARPTPTAEAARTLPGSAPVAEAAPALEGQASWPATSAAASALPTPQQRLAAARAAVQAVPLPSPAAAGAPGAWDQAVGQRVLFMAQQRVESAQLRIDPPHLGPVQVQISVQDDQAQLLFQAHHPQTREALESALPRLRELFAQEGLQLDSAEVADRGAGQGRDAPGDRDARGWGHPGADDPAGEAPPPSSPLAQVAAGTAQRGVARGLIDEFV